MKKAENRYAANAAAPGGHQALQSGRRPPTIETLRYGNVNMRKMQPLLDKLGKKTAERLFGLLGRPGRNGAYFAYIHIVEITALANSGYSIARITKELNEKYGKRKK